ncbi:MAG: polymerase IV protein [candidate division WWE3 bacterium GW2011_GWC1_47_10]|uniref:Polymerase IV protein n=1 Tax=candidate division WWE3 bacterium GW2011_GWC1_47_10 TaxID=1619122 RepID=A0A0G1T9Y4_UNCKA|nr:MAG: polymerase IV protein [candidate division WWE3 bacterium GW2011_GWC1_47_10]
MHIDFDSFFASVEQQANPYFRNKPLGVTGSSLTRGVICAASREAKKHGIKTGMPVFRAREQCPQIIIVTGDFTKYQYIHKKSLELFARFTDLVEPFSIDEAFIDVTQTQRFFGGAKNKVPPARRLWRICNLLNRRRAEQINGQAGLRF